MQHPESLRNKVIERALAGGVSQDALAKEFGVSRSSIQNWLREYRHSGGQNMPPKEKSPQSWSRSQRLDALLETHTMSDEQRSAWCRQRGVHTHQLEQWRHELLDSDSATASEASQARSLRQENKALKKELRRKEKALAETTALLVLKKKRPTSGGKPRTVDHGCRARSGAGAGGRSRSWRLSQECGVRGIGTIAAYGSTLAARRCVRSASRHSGGPGESPQ